jgi:hypothetical protein
MASRPQAVAGGVNSVTKEKPDGADPEILRQIAPNFTSPQRIV